LIDFLTTIDKFVEFLGYTLLIMPNSWARKKYISAENWILESLPKQGIMTISTIVLNVIGTRTSHVYLCTINPYKPSSLGETAHVNKAHHHQNTCNSNPKTFALHSIGSCKPLVKLQPSPAV